MISSTHTVHAPSIASLASVVSENVTASMIGTTNPAIVAPRRSRGYRSSNAAARWTIASRYSVRSPNTRRIWPIGYSWPRSVTGSPLRIPAWAICRANSRFTFVSRGRMPMPTANATATNTSRCAMLVHQTSP